MEVVLVRPPLYGVSLVGAVVNQEVLALIVEIVMNHNNKDSEKGQ